jgi:hypothetical protein
METALSILRTKSIWLTDIKNMNDANEELMLYELFMDALFQYDHSKGYQLRQLEEYLFSLQNQMWTTYCVSGGRRSKYVACFSEDGDSVSQWEMYGDGGNGIAIGFDRDAFKSLAECNNDSFRFNKIQYLNKEIIESDVRKIYEDLIQIQMLSNSNNQHILAESFFKSIVKNYNECSLYKGIHYKNEKEIRIIYMNELDHEGDFKSKNRGIELMWRLGPGDVYAKRNCLNTYRSLNFNKHIIKDIVYGPKAMYDPNNEPKVLHLLGYDCNEVKLRKSTSGYR